MTCKLNPALRKIQSPVVLVTDGAETVYQNGEALTELFFEARYDIASIAARDNTVIIRLQKARPFEQADDPEISFF